MKKNIFILFLLVTCHPIFSATYNIADGDVAALINAIIAANANTEADIINLAINGTYILNAVNSSTDAGQSGNEGRRGFPHILDNVSALDLTINGNGATIQRNTSAPEFDLFSCSGHTIFNNITFRNGRVNAQGEAILLEFKVNIEVNNCFFYDNVSLLNVEGGGAIYTKSLSTLRVTNPYFENNTAINQGGAISNLFSNMTLIGNTFKNNRTTDLTGDDPAGRAVYSDGARRYNGALIIKNNFFESNSSNGSGQGATMFLFLYRNETVEVTTGCTFKTNSANQAGAFWHKGGGSKKGIPDPEYPSIPGPENTTLTLNNCIFDNNTSNSQVGGLWLSDCTINEIYNCTFKNNSATLGGGICLITNCPFTTRNCTFNNNTANVAGAINAGISAKLTIQNCTFTTNIANQYGGALSVPQDTTPVDIINYTFAYNQANNPVNGQSGAIHLGNSNLPNPTVMIKNVIFYNQTVTNDYGGIWRDCNSTLNDDGNNIFFPVMTGDNCVITENANFVNPLLSSLVDNGGPIQTMALLAGSGCPSLDQCGATRIGNCDIGAYEYASVLSTENIAENKNKLLLYLNPSAGEFFLKLPLEYETKEGKMQIFALDGKLILEKKLNENNTNIINLTAKGIYILKTIMETQTLTNKILVH